jgi:cardiolipin synthase
VPAFPRTRIDTWRSSLTLWKAARRGTTSHGVGGIRILDDVGVKVHKLKHLKLHAKVLLADEKRAIVGSINLSPGSFDRRRELAIEVDDRHIVKRLHHVARHERLAKLVLELARQSVRIGAVQ